MASPEASRASKINRPNYSYAIVSTALVLFVLGLLGMLFLNARALSKHFKENVELTLVLDDAAEEEAIIALQQGLERQNYTKQARYVSKQEAGERFKEANDEDFHEVLDYNPLFASISLFLNAGYAHTDSLEKIKKTLTKQPIIKEVFYQENLVDLIHANTQRLGFILLVLSAVFLVIAFTLIDNTIKLAMYANRFLIKSMQLVGAKQDFITQPFLQQSYYNGFLSGLIASALLFLVLLLLQNSIPEIRILNSVWKMILLCAFLIAAGIAINWWSTKRSVTKYLKKPLEELY